MAHDTPTTNFGHLTSEEQKKLAALLQSEEIKKILEKLEKRIKIL